MQYFKNHCTQVFLLTLSMFVFFALSLQVAFAEEFKNELCLDKEETIKELFTVESALSRTLLRTDTSYLLERGWQTPTTSSEFIDCGEFRVLFATSTDIFGTPLSISFSDVFDYYFFSTTSLDVQSSERAFHDYSQIEELFERAAKDEKITRFMELVDRDQSGFIVETDEGGTSNKVTFGVAKSIVSANRSRITYDGFLGGVREYYLSERFEDVAPGEDFIKDFKEYFIAQQALAVFVSPKDIEKMYFIMERTEGDMFDRGFTWLLHGVDLTELGFVIDSELSFSVIETALRSKSAYHVYVQDDGRYIFETDGIYRKRESMHSEGAIELIESTIRRYGDGPRPSGGIPQNEFVNVPRGPDYNPSDIPVQGKIKSQDEILINFLQTGVFTEIEEVELVRSGQTPRYIVKGWKRVRILFIIPLKMKKTVTVNAETGLIEYIEKPKWASFAHE